jgi:CheY-like chemotaxis protein
LLALMVIDDDELSREVMSLIAAEVGFEVETFASGDEALEFLVGAEIPRVVLADMQMPGISGDALAERLRRVCGDETKLLAISGSSVPADQVEKFDGFLLKPFSAEELKAACDETPVQASSDAQFDASILNEAVYQNFARSMPSGQVAALYQMCIDDAARRIATMRRAAGDRDDAVYRRSAHAIKGSCGMVGALELARLAAEMETLGLPVEHDVTPLDHFLAASARLGRMLDNKAGGPRVDAPAVRP